MAVINRFQKAWNAFLGRDPTYFPAGIGYGGTYDRPDKNKLSYGNEKSIVSSIYNQIAMDCAEIDIKHIKTDKDGRYMEDVDSGLNNCLTLSANIDQTGRQLRQDIVLSMCDEGCVAVVPVDTTDNPDTTNSYDILTLRVGRIVQWFPSHVKVELYNERIGKKEEIIVAKDDAAIIENPFYAVMNEPNSTLKRLIRKINLLDVVDEQSGAGKLDLIIQLPYTIKGETRRQQANERVKTIEAQLAGSKYGIAYADATEHITQLNRSVDNNLMNQVQYLTSMLYSQLGLTETIFNGTADEQTMLNYYNRTIEPILSAITDELRRKFLTKTARTQGQDIRFFRNPFKLVPTSQVPEIADKLTRNEVMSSNEVRDIIGLKPSSDPKADQLINANLNQPEEEDVNVDIDKIIKKE